jgi:[CysO sulfur-carrier protein]-S-L-cysteine hydrolase
LNYFKKATVDILLPPEIVSKIIDALTKAGSREIGGILMGEHVGVDTFRVKDLTIQRRGSTFATFIRFIEEIIGPLRDFFSSTGHDYIRFNYLGEWHSHPSFALIPSKRDHATMLEIIMDPKLGANFVVLLLAKLNASNHLEHTVTVYQPNEVPIEGRVLEEEIGDNGQD